MLLNIAITVAALLYCIAVLYVFCSCFTMLAEEPDRPVRAWLYLLSWSIFWPVSFLIVLFYQLRWGGMVSHYSDPPDAEYSAANVLVDFDRGGFPVNRISISSEDRL